MSDLKYSDLHTHLATLEKQGLHEPCRLRALPQGRSERLRCLVGPVGLGGCPATGSLVRDESDQCHRNDGEQDG